MELIGYNITRCDPNRSYGGSVLLHERNSISTHTDIYVGMFSLIRLQTLKGYNWGSRLNAISHVC